MPAIMSLSTHESKRKLSLECVNWTRLCGVPKNISHNRHRVCILLDNWQKIYWFLSPLRNSIQNSVHWKYISSPSNFQHWNYCKSESSLLRSITLFCIWYRTSVDFCSQFWSMGISWSCLTSLCLVMFSYIMVQHIDTFTYAGNLGLS